MSAGLVGAVLGDWQARYLFCTCTCLNNHFLITAKTGNLLKFVSGAMIGRYRINRGKRPLMCQYSSFYPKLNHGDWCYWQKNSPLPSSWDASEQFGVNLHSTTSLEKKSFPQPLLGATPGCLSGLGCGEVLISISKLWKCMVYPPLHDKPQTQIPETGRSR